jgi:hypothetical protein
MNGLPVFSSEVLDLGRHALAAAYPLCTLARQAQQGPAQRMLALKEHQVFTGRLGPDGGSPHTVVVTARRATSTKESTLRLQV